jgi:hypothetical protein
MPRAQGGATATSWVIPSADEAEQELSAFAKSWDAQNPAISPAWYRHWPDLITLFDYPDEIRKVIYTTNAIESLKEVLINLLIVIPAFMPLGCRPESSLFNSLDPGLRRGDELIRASLIVSFARPLRIARFLHHNQST